MSVILYGDEKFYRIYETLRLKGKKIACVFGYPEGWNEWNGMDETLKLFVNDLREANTMTWNRQYQDDIRPVKALDFNNGHTTEPYSNDFELLKSLEGLSYNLISNDGRETDLQGCKERLNWLIYNLMSRIIDKIPEYNKADTW